MSSEALGTRGIGSPKRILSGVQPTGQVHLGNYLGAFRRWAAMQKDGECIYLIVDLHSLTNPEDMGDISANTINVARTLMACGVTPDESLMFVQSHVPKHAELCWVLMCHTAMGELNRMTQYKDRIADNESAGRIVGAGVFTYPVLMAADIALYGATEIPVGADQRQHVELARDIVNRFNRLHGGTLTVPVASIAAVGSRIMDLQNPRRKMSKSSSSESGIIYLTDSPDTVYKKIRSAATDHLRKVDYDPENQPGVSNLIGIIAGIRGKQPDEISSEFTNYSQLKSAVADAIIEELHPIQLRLKELESDGEILSALCAGAATANVIAEQTMARVRSSLTLSSL